MKCSSCQTDIDPKWSHAINRNVCPYCGALLLPEHLKNCLVQLASAMEVMQQYPEQLDDWLLSNHNYIKTNNPSLYTYVPSEVMLEIKEEVKKTLEASGEYNHNSHQITKSVKPNQHTIQTIKIADGKGGFKMQEVLIEKTMTNEKANEFFERAVDGPGKSVKAMKEKAGITGTMDKKGAGGAGGAGEGEEDQQPKSVAEKTAHLKAMAQQIKEEVKSGVTGQETLAAMIAAENGEMREGELIDVSDPSAVSQLQNAIVAGDPILSNLSPSNNSGGDFDDGDEIPAVVLRMSQTAQTKGNSNPNKDLELLQRQVDKSKKMSGSFSR